MGFKQVPLFGLSLQTKKPISWWHSRNRFFGCVCGRKSENKNTRTNDRTTEQNSPNNKKTTTTTTTQPNNEGQHTHTQGRTQKRKIMTEGFFFKSFFLFQLYFTIRERERGRLSWVCLALATRNADIRLENQMKTNLRIR